MWPFKSVNKLIDSGMLQGFTDWHSHILPGVDDGFRSLESSLEALARYEEVGIRKIWLTPHIMEDYPNTPEGLRERFAMLTEAYKGGIELRLAAENMLDPVFEERIASGDLLPIGDEGKHLLVETSYMNPPYGMDDMIESVFSAGYFPLLAHPERYRYMEERDYRKWKERGVLFQINYFSLTGGYGEQARKKCEWLLEQGMVDVCGSDLHRLEFFEHCISQAPAKRKHLDALVSVAQNPTIR